MSESQDSCNAEIARLQAEVQRLEKELYYATHPKPGWEYRVLYKCGVGVFHMSEWYYTSLESFKSSPIHEPVDFVFATGRQKYE